MRWTLIFTFLVFFAGATQDAVAEMVDLPEVKIQALDKSTARTTTLNTKVGDTIKYGSLFIKVQACRQSAPLDKPENAAFLQIWEIPVGKKKSEWAFSGWMFSSSPALSAMDHAVYDVWVLECLGGEEAEEKENVEESSEVDADSGEAEESSENEDTTTRIEAESFDNVINGLTE